MASVWMLCQLVAADGPVRFRTAVVSSPADARQRLEIWLEQLQLPVPRLLFVAWVRLRREVRERDVGMPETFGDALAQLEVVGVGVPRGSGIAMRWDVGAFA